MGKATTIRVWKLGDHKEGILPSKKAVERLADVLAEANDKDGSVLDIIWDSMISVTVIKDGVVTTDEGLTAEDVEDIKVSLSKINN